MNILNNNLKTVYPKNISKKARTMAGSLSIINSSIFSPAGTEPVFLQQTH